LISSGSDRRNNRQANVPPLTGTDEHRAHLYLRMVRLIRQAHLYVGLAGIVAFLATGLYMDRFHEHLRGYDDTLRMLYRSTHIYLLLSAVINTMMGLYLRPADSSWRRVLQCLGSVSLLAGPPLLLAGFCTEPYLSSLARPWSRPAIYLALAGTVLHLVAALPRWPSQHDARDEELMRSRGAE
jgi:hypothetical protein